MKIGSVHHRLIIMKTLLVIYFKSIYSADHVEHMAFQMIL